MRIDKAAGDDIGVGAERGRGARVILGAVGGVTVALALYILGAGWLPDEFRSVWFGIGLLLGAAGVGFGVAGLVVGGEFFEKNMRRVAVLVGGLGLVGWWSTFLTVALADMVGARIGVAIGIIAMVYTILGLGFLVANSRAFLRLELTFRYVLSVAGVVLLFIGLSWFIARDFAYDYSGGDFSLCLNVNGESPYPVIEPDALSYYTFGALGGVYKHWVEPEGC